jgi:hypothetical protein
VWGPAAGAAFGGRIVGAPPAVARGAESAVNTIVGTPSLGGRLGLSGAAALGSQWGRVTSTYRSVGHNREVGGVANSFHLSGRAVDIARRSGVSHHMIDSAFRRAGYRIVESLDEGDHSHFAFAFGPPRVTSLTAAASSEVTRWHVVYAPRDGGR